MDVEREDLVGEGGLVMFTLGLVCIGAFYSFDFSIGHFYLHFNESSTWQNLKRYPILFQSAFFRRGCGVSVQSETS